MSAEEKNLQNMAEAEFAEAAEREALAKNIVEKLFTRFTAEKIEELQWKASLRESYETFMDILESPTHNFSKEEQLVNISLLEDEFLKKCLDEQGAEKFEKIMEKLKQDKKKHMEFHAQWRENKEEVLDAEQEDLRVIEEAKQALGIVETSEDDVTPPIDENQLNMGSSDGRYGFRPKIEQ